MTTTWAKQLSFRSSSHVGELVSIDTRLVRSIFKLLFLTESKNSSCTAVCIDLFNRGVQYEQSMMRENAL